MEPLFLLSVSTIITECDNKSLLAWESLTTPFQHNFVSKQISLNLCYKKVECSRNQSRIKCQKSEVSRLLPPHLRSEWKWVTANLMSNTGSACAITRARGSWKVLDNNPDRIDWNLEMLVFEERGKPEYPEKNLSEQGREPTTNSTHIWTEAVIARMDTKKYGETLRDT